MSRDDQYKQFVSASPLLEMLDEQKRQTDRFRDLLAPSSLGVLDGLISDQQLKADRFSELIGPPVSEGLEQFMSDRSASEAIKQIVESGAHASLAAKAIYDSTRAFALPKYEPFTDAIFGSGHGLLPTRHERIMNESPELERKLRELEKQLAQLRADVSDKTRALHEQEAGSARKDEDIRELQQKNEELTQTQRLAHLLARVEPAAQRKLLDSDEFRAQFDRQEPCDAFVMSIDIRRSTELMLKAREPKLFAEFILQLTNTLREIVLLNHGIFDKFTGDGVLAFFPLFYSGPDAGLFVLQAAEHAHTAFAKRYDDHRHCFLTILRDVGLGIGVDFGRVQIVQLGSEFTVVGTPVVYACRMAGAEAGHTLVNQPAYEQLSARHSVVCDFAPVDLLIKHEGRTLGYSTRLNGRPYEAAGPEWYSSGEQRRPNSNGLKIKS